MEMYNQLQLREIFHLEFLRRLARKIKPEHYAVKGGSCLRFFFKSIRYSEDMDLDLRGLRVDIVKDTVMNILESRDFQKNLTSFGAEQIVPPDMSRSKQTETTQRFKVHIITASGEDLFTKVEFSRRGFKGNVIIESVEEEVLRGYKMPPLLAPHYDARSLIIQKINALAARTTIQARDIFDIYTMGAQCDIPRIEAEKGVGRSKIKIAHANLFEVSFEQFRDTVISYLAVEDQALYASVARWDEIKLRVASFLESAREL